MRVLEELAIGGIEGFIGRLPSPLEGVANALHGYLYGRLQVSMKGAASSWRDQRCHHTSSCHKEVK